MSDAIIRWAVLKTFTVSYAGDELVTHHSGDFLREEASSWSSRALEQLREGNKIAPVVIPSDEWLLGEAERRGLVGGVSGDGGEAAAVPAAEEADINPEIQSASSSERPEAADSGPASFPQHLGGQDYELSDGSTVRGRRAADAAQRALDTLVEA